MLRKVFQLAGQLFVGSALGKLVVFMVFPIYTHFVAPEDLGYYDLSITYGTIVAGLVFMDIWVGVLRRLLDPGRTLVDRERSVRGGFLLVCVSLVVLFLVAGIVQLALAPQYVWWVLGCVGTGGLRDFWTSVARGKGETRAFAYSGIVASLATAAISSLFVWGLSMGVQSLYLGVIGGNLIQIAILESRVQIFGAVFRNRVDWSELRWLLVFCAPLAINSVSYWIFSGAGRIAVSYEMTIADNGIFAAASKFGAVVGLFSAVFTLVWQQLSFTKGVDDRLFFERGMLLSCATYLGGAVLSAPLSMWLYRVLMAHSFAAGVSAVPGFILVAALAGYSTFVGNIFYAIDRTKIIFYSTLSVLLVVGLTSVLFVRLFGIDGANISLALGYIVGLVIRVSVLRRVANIRDPWKFELFSVAVMIVVWGACVSNNYVLLTITVILGSLFALMAVSRSLGRGQFFQKAVRSRWD